MIGDVLQSEESCGGGSGADLEDTRMHGENAVMGFEFELYLTIMLT